MSHAAIVVRGAAEPNAESSLGWGTDRHFGAADLVVRSSLVVPAEKTRWTFLPFPDMCLLR